jgi:hypothetical protein
MGAPRNGLENLGEKIKKGMETMKYMKTSIQGFTQIDLEIMSLDHKIQSFENELATFGVKISKTAEGYSAAQPLGIAASDAQKLEFSLLKSDTAAYMKQHPVAKKAYESFYRQLNSMIVTKINNLPPIEDLSSQISEINSILNSHDVKRRLSDKHPIYEKCDRLEKILTELTQIHTTTSSIKATTNKFYQSCAAAHKQLEGLSNEVARKLVAASPAGRERDARAAAGGAVNPVAEENKRGV